MSIDLDTAQTMVDRARTRAMAIGVPMNFADGCGHLLTFDRLERS
ncbi:hypothetical protein [Streptomyces sp. NPDC059564]